MEINNVSTPMPALPEAPREPPRDAEIVTAVRETQSADAGNNDTRSGGDAQSEQRQAPSPDSSLGNFVNETV